MASAGAKRVRVDLNDHNREKGALAALWSITSAVRHSSGRCDPATFALHSINTTRTSRRQRRLSRDTIANHGSTLPAGTPAIVFRRSLGGHVVTATTSSLPWYWGVISGGWLMFSPHSNPHNFSGRCTTLPVVCMSLSACITAIRQDDR